MENLIIASSPHIRTKDSVRGIMLDVIIALIPATVAAGIIFGGKALALCAVSIVTCVAAEYLFNLIVGKKCTIGNLSAVLTGLLLGLNLSTNVELWQCAVGAVVAIVIAKGLFGGIGKNFANPAITARVFMIIAFSTVAGGAAPAVVDVVSSATPLEMMAAGNDALPTVGQMLLGVHASGAVGETCIIALVLGYIYLCARRVIKWYVPFGFIATVFVLSLIISGDGSYALYQTLGGGVFLGAIFMATDYVSTPLTSRGKLVFAIGCGVLTVIIRHCFAYPEGVSFSILIMNILSPYIEKFTANKVLGG